MRRCFPIFCLLAMTMGCDSSSSSSGSDQPTHPAWLVGSWDHDEGREGYADYADYSLVFDSEGSYTWFYAVSVLDGTWRMDGARLTFDGQEQSFAVAKNCRVISLGGKTYLGSNDPTSCPTQPAPLSAIENCAVGYFTAGTPNGGIRSHQLDADRTMIEFYDDPGYTSGGSSYTRVGEFSIDAVGGIMMTSPDGSVERRATVQGLLGMSRGGATDPGCDMAGFLALGGDTGGNDMCSLSCATGRTCDAYGGYETCCPDAYPFYCPDLFVCFDSDSARDAACANGYYSDPEFGCESGQEMVSLDGAVGDYCAAHCNGSGSYCPSAYDGTPGSCSITYNGSSTPSLCALRCTDLGVTGGQCPNPMKCTAVASGNGFCLFP